MIKLKNGNNSLYKIEEKVRAMATSTGYSLTGQPLNAAIAQMISMSVMSVMEGIRALVEEQYTDEDFEKDLTLRS